MSAAPPEHGNAAGLSFGARGWTPDANAADPHLFRGRLDRPCDVCGMPDRAPLHLVALARREAA